LASSSPRSGARRVFGIGGGGGKPDNGGGKDGTRCHPVKDPPDCGT